MEGVVFRMVGDVEVGIHLLIVLFILPGLPLVYVGVTLHWAWVRSWRWRMLHLGAILFVAAESMLGITCPLTVWGATLRGRPTPGRPLAPWIDKLLFYPPPT